MKEKRPLVLNIALGLIIIRLAAILLIITLFYLAGDVDIAEQTAMAGFKTTIIEHYGLDATNFDYAFGQLLGALTVPSIFIILSLIFFLARQFWVLLFMVTIDLLVSSVMGSPIFAIIILIMVLSNPGRRYFRRKNKAIPATVEAN